MRVLFLTQYYPPETGAAPLRAYHFARGLKRAGHDVTVLTGMPNHPSGVKAAGYARRLFMREDAGGVRVLRAYLFASPTRTFVRRMLNQLSFAVCAALCGPWIGRPDIILVSSPPLFLGFSGWFTAILRGVPYVLDVRDYWPHAAVALGQLRSRRMIAMAERLEGFLYRRAAKIVAVTPGMVKLMRERGIPDHQIIYIPNGADTDVFGGDADAVPSGDPADRDAGSTVGARELGPGDGDPDNDEDPGGITVLYSGTHGLVHGMDVILDAAEHLEGDHRLHFLFVGDGSDKERLIGEAERRGIANVRFLSSQAPHALAATMREADVCLATTDGSDFSRGTIPVKIFDYMACSRPVVAALDGDGRGVVEDSGGGIVVAPGDGRALADALVCLADDPERRRSLGERGCAFVRKRCSRRVLAQRMENVLSSVTAAEAGLGTSYLPFRRYLGVKYTLDFIGALTTLVVCSPIFALVALLIRLDSPGRSVFTQQRIGVLSHEFTIYKFRTMRQDTPDLATDLIAPMQTDYTTRIGRVLRRTGIDELPNLLNVVRGDMSLVGPRPALYNQYELIDLRRQTLGDQVRPGLTGWAQINGRDSITMDEKVRLDAFYVRNCSFVLDIRILINTAAVLSDTE